MKTAKHHLINWQSGKTICGLTNFKSDSIRLASFESGKWFDDYGDELDTTNWDSIFCMNCLKLHESNLIDQFKLQTFLIKYEMELPNCNRARKKRNAVIRSNRIKGIKTESVSAQLDKAKSNKGKARAKRKAQSKSKSIIKTTPIERVIGLFPAYPTESKCIVKSKPKKKKKQSKPIEYTDLGWENENKELDLKSDVIELTDMVDVKPIDNWEIGDPIDNDILELAIGDNWKLVRHNKELDKWQFQTKTVNKKNKVSKWIQDSEWIDYKFASEMINSGYCE